MVFFHSHPLSSIFISKIPLSLDFSYITTQPCININSRTAHYTKQWLSRKVSRHTIPAKGLGALGRIIKFTHLSSTTPMFSNPEIVKFRAVESILSLNPVRYTDNGILASVIQFSWTLRVLVMIYLCRW